MVPPLTPQRGRRDRLSDDAITGATAAVKVPIVRLKMTLLIMLVAAATASWTDVRASRVGEDEGTGHRRPNAPAEMWIANRTGPAAIAETHDMVAGRGTGVIEMPGGRLTIAMTGGTVGVETSAVGVCAGEEGPTTALWQALLCAAAAAGAGAEAGAGAGGGEARARGGDSTDGGTPAVRRRRRGGVGPREVVTEGEAPEAARRLLAERDPLVVPTLRVGDAGAAGRRPPGLSHRHHRIAKTGRALRRRSAQRRVGRSRRRGTQASLARALPHPGRGRPAGAGAGAAAEATAQGAGTEAEAARATAVAAVAAAPPVSDHRQG